MGIKIIGIDEVGRGAVAGPLFCAGYACSVEFLQELKNISKEYATKNRLSPKRTIRIDRLLGLINYDIELAQADSYNKRAQISEKITPTDFEIFLNVYDSKKITKNTREKIARVLLGYNKFSLNSFNAKIIDEVGIQKVNKQARKNCNNNLIAQLGNDFITISDYIAGKDTENKILNVKKGDSTSFCVSCASIIAKVYRDNLMYEYSKIYPQYGFEKHVGYGTKYHLEKIKEFGICKIHRKSFLQKY